MVDEERKMARARKIDNVIPLNVSNETDDQVEDRIAERFSILDILAKSAIAGDVRSVIVSGSPGCGKSYTVLKELENYDPSGNTYTVIKGYAKSTGLVKTLYNYRHPGNIIVFDDIDNIFYDDVSLNLLKAVADTCDNRRVSYLSEYKLLDEETGEIVPRNFDFEGTIVFLTNLDFQQMVDKGHKLAPHLDALMSRSLYLDLTLKTRKDKLVRIRNVVEHGLLSHLDIDQQVDVLTFLEIHFEHLRELSLREVIKLGQLRKTNSSWEKIARITLCK
jgi:hypothetical protein